jgi:hypothetical protein
MFAATATPGAARPRQQCRSSPGLAKERKTGPVRWAPVDLALTNIVCPIWLLSGSRKIVSHFSAAAGVVREDGDGGVVHPARSIVTIG